MNTIWAWTRRLMMVTFAEADKGGGGVDAAAEKAAADKIAADKAASDKAAADAAAATRAEAEKSWKPAQKAAADAAADAAKTAGKSESEIAAAREEAARAAGESETGAKAPAKYDLKLPESSTFAPEDVTAFEAWARSLDLTNEQAQKAIDGQTAMIDVRLTEFKEETAADTEYGGDKLAETQRLANLALDKVRPKGHARRDDLLRVLEHTGYINHIGVVSFLADLGKLMDEDTSGGGTGGGGVKARTEDRMFPKTAKAS